MNRIAPVRRIQRVHGFEVLRTDGTLPAGLRGTLYRAGPGLFERGGVALQHPFEADGAVTAVRLDGSGGAQGAVRYVENAVYKQEEAAGRWLTGSATARWRRVLNLVQGRIKNSGNTSMMQWQSRLFALMEAGKPVEMCPDTLATLGDTDLGALTGAFSAHPRRHPTRPCQINFGVRFGPTTFLDLYELPDAGPVRSLGSVEAPWGAMVHDFALTERYAVFVVGPSRIQLGRAMFGEPDMAKLFSWEPDMGARVMVVPLDALEDAFQIEMPSCWVWHVANGFEQGDSLVVDVSQYPNFDSLHAIADPDAPIAPPEYVRYRIDVAARTATAEVVWDLPMEFPSVTATQAGRAHTRTYLLSTPEAKTTRHGRHAVGWFDASANTSSVFTFEQGITASEPIFVPQAGAEGHLLTLITNAERTASGLAVLDAERVPDGPVATVWFEQPLPDTFHGTFAAG